MKDKLANIKDKAMDKTLDILSNEWTMPVITGVLCGISAYIGYKAGIKDTSKAFFKGLLDLAEEQKIE